ncbi:MAG: sigma-70 family RNA polymerase sigma factor, partial [Planctomycetales bacterium]|nr:sigma-70 family RNA polymerase sigma factor [Planctomycetales bacterium]
GDVRELAEAINSLPDHERIVVVLRYLDGHSTQDIASILERPIGTVTKQLSRAIARLQKILNKTEVRK